VAPPDEDALGPTRVLALSDELESAIKLIDLGVRELHGLSLANDYYHLPMQLLAQGLERLLKLTYAVADLGEKGALPSGRAIARDFGHDLVALADALTERVKGAETYVHRPAVRDDLEFVRSDEDLRRVLTVLSEFGMGGRYHRLDEFLDPESVRDRVDPYRDWERLESEIVRRQPAWAERIGDPRAARELQRGAITYVAQLVDRFARALARMWTLGALPSEAQRYTALVGAFLYLRDEALGVPR
jgi:hypothetical protein